MKIMKRRPISVPSSGPRRSFPKRESCERCHSREVVPICYGLPTEEAFAEAEKGEFVLGGCMVRDALWHCKSCGYRWPEEGA